MRNAWSAAMSAATAAALVLPTTGATAAVPGDHVGKTPASLTATYGRLPLLFEENKGQTDPRVRFLSRGAGYSLFLTDTDAVLDLQKPLPRTNDGKASPHPTITRGSVLRLKLAGARKPGAVSGEQPLAAKVNYFAGKDPSRWRTNLRTFGRVGYKGVYKGVDLVYYGNRQQLEYDFHVARGADPTQIRLAFEGADRLTLTKAGDLVVHLKGGGAVVEHAPVAYQRIAGVRRPVRSRYVLVADASDHGRTPAARFALGAYDAARPLVIDPVLSYSTYLGSSSAEQGFAIAVDSSGYAYITGNATSSGFPTTSGAYQTTTTGTCAFVTKLSTDGTSLIYSTLLGASETDGRGIAVDADGSAYVTGYTLNAYQFPTTTGAYQTSAPYAFFAAFITKLSSNGSSLDYSTLLTGSTSSDTYKISQAFGIAVDSSGCAYVVGDTNFSDFPTTSGAYQTSYGGNWDLFVTKLASDGSSLAYSTYLGGSSYDYPGQLASIALDSSGHAYVTGSTQSTNFPTTSGAYQTTMAAPTETFVTELASNGTSLVYSTFLGGSSTTIGSAGASIAVDSSGAAYVVGTTYDSTFPTTTGAYQTTPGSGNMFVTKLSSGGGSLSYSTFLSNGTPSGIVVDSSGAAYITGTTSYSSFPTTTGAYQTTYAPNGDAFVTKLASSGSSLDYSTFFSGTTPYGYDSEGNAIAVDSSGAAYITGDTNFTDLPTTSGAYQTSSPGGSADAFVTKLSIP